MTLAAALILEDAFEVYVKIAGADNGPISTQTPSWQPPSTPYDHAARLVQALLPLAYNYPAEDHARTEVIWTTMVDALQVLPIDVALRLSKS